MVVTLSPAIRAPQVQYEPANVMVLVLYVPGAIRTSSVTGVAGGELRLY